MAKEMTWGNYAHLECPHCEYVMRDLWDHAAFGDGRVIQCPNCENDVLVREKNELIAEPR